MLDPRPLRLTWTSGITVACVREGGDPVPGGIGSYVLARRDDASLGLVLEDRNWSWSEVVAESLARAALLDSIRGPGPFHVGVLLENVPEYVFLLLGSALCGATVVGINPTRRGDELAADVRHTDCQVVVTDPAGLGLLEGLDVGAASAGLLDCESASYTDLVEDHAASGPPASVPDASSLYLLIFTAGSTGAPKAVRMSQGRAARTAAESARAFHPDDVLYCAMPLFHGNALVANLFPALISGASVVLRRRFSASSFVSDIRRHGCTYFNYVGRALSYIVALPETADERDNRLKWALGSEASPQNIAEFTRRFGCPVFEGYGSSENAVVIAPGPGTPPGALGLARSGTDVAIVDPLTGEECPVALLDGDGRLLNPEEAIGEIVGRNSLERFEGYYNNPEAEVARSRDGWYWTGDLGYRDAESFIYFAGRSADWLRVDGENFSAGRVESILNRFVLTSGAAAFGVPDPVSGDQVMAVLELHDPDAFDPVGFAQFLEAQPDLGTKWAPRFVRTLRSLPVTGAGKVDKAPLRREAWLDGKVWWRPGKELIYEVFAAADEQSLRAAFAVAGRERFFPG